MDNEQTRIDWIDFAKGITIILTIIGHSAGSGIYGSILRGTIFSFHMPLFFVLSAITCKYSISIEDFKKRTQKAAYHLLPPAIIVFVLMSLLQVLLDNGVIFTKAFWLGRMYTFIWGSGVKLTFDDVTVQALGIPWFFFVLFSGRTIFDYFHLNIKNKANLLIVSCLIGLLGISFGKTQWMPFSLDIAFAIVPLLFFGLCLQGYTVNGNYKRISIYLVIWLFTLYMTFPDYNKWTYLELACRRYTLFPICYISAAAGIMFIAELSFICNKIKLISSIFKFIGKNSLYLLCIHAIDQWWKILFTSNGQFKTILKRVVVDLIIFFVYMLIVIGIKKFYNKNKG